MADTVAARLSKLGFKSSSQRTSWIQDNKQQILTYREQHGDKATMDFFHIAMQTLQKLQRWTAEQNTDRITKSAMSPTELANALLDRMITLQSDNSILRLENGNLKGRVQYLEGQLELERERATKEFQEKLQRALAIPGD